MTEKSVFGFTLVVKKHFPSKLLIAVGAGTTALPFPHSLTVHVDECPHGPVIGLVLPPWIALDGLVNGAAKVKITGIIVREHCVLLVSVRDFETNLRNIREQIT